eukprot:scaffold1554_cov401-Prasinococcus_capsulatus_cf.AAC.7
MLATAQITHHLQSLLGTKRGGQKKTHCDLGDQDLYSIMAVHAPELFYTLPCEYVAQARRRALWRR